MSPRILVCDDHPVVRDALATCLRALSDTCVVGECANAAELVERLGDADRWDLVLLDLELPDAFGLEALRRVRARAPDVRVAVVSAHDDRATVQRALGAGAVDVVSKGVDRGRLLDALRRLLDLPAAADEARGHGRPRGAPACAPADDGWVHDALAALSARQTQVLRLMVRGLPNKEICAELGLSENTVKIHIGAVLRGLRARNRTEAVSRASRVGFGGG